MAMFALGVFTTFVFLVLLVMFLGSYISDESKEQMERAKNPKLCKDCHWSLMSGSPVCSNPMAADIVTGQFLKKCEDIRKSGFCKEFGFEWKKKEEKENAEGSAK